MAKYLDENGLSILWNKITDKVAALKCYDTGASDTKGTWTVTIPGITALTEGLTIKIRLKTSYNGTTNTLNLNGLGAKTIYFRYGNKLTSHYSKESVLALTYTTDAISSGNDRTGWIIENIYDSTNTYQLRKYYTRYKTKSALYRYMICFINKDDELIPANNVSNSTATTKALTTESFMLSKGIYYYNSTTTVAAAGYTGNATLYQQLGLVDLRYSFNTGTTLTANKPVYLVVRPQADGQVKLASTPIAQALPTSDTSNWYVFLGTAYDNYRIELPIEHPIYAYHNGYCESLDHTHYNKTILDNTTASFTTTDKTNLGNVLNVAAANTNKITTLEGNVVKLTDNQTINGVKTFNAPANSNGTEQTTMKIKTANGGAIIFGKEGPNSGSMIRLDQTDGTTRLQFRASSTPGAMVWKQPESGAALYFDFGPNAARTTMPTSGGTLAYTSQIPTALKNPHALTFGKKTYDGSSAQTITASDLGALTSHQSLADYAKKSDIPTKVSELTNDSGFTTNKGTVTSVAVKMNGTTKGTVTSSGTIDLGTIITSLPSLPDFDDVGSWHEGQIMVASGQGSMINSGVGITDITDDIVALKSAATSSSLGLVKLGSDTVQSTAANSVTSTSSRTYAVQKNSNGQLVVNVPWTTSSASIPSDLAKLVNSGTNYIQIERYGSSSYGMRIQTGKVSVNKAETINTEVKFPNSTLFSGIPVVILTPVINNTADTRQIDTELTGVTKTNFHFSCALGNTSYRITEVHYIAIQLI